MVQLRYLLHIPLIGAKPIRKGIGTEKVAEERNAIPFRKSFHCTSSQRFSTYFLLVSREDSIDTELCHVEGIHKIIALSHTHTHTNVGPVLEKNRLYLQQLVHKANTSLSSLLTQYLPSHLGKLSEKVGASSFLKVSQRE